ncbi:MAG TPA: TolC family protein [Bacteroidales bacterium]|nr:TolC family protein [Bacteroidales bacterium]
MPSCRLNAVLLMILLIPFTVFSQSPEDDGFDSGPLNIPSLEVIIDSALNRSPLLKKYDAALDAEAFNLSFEKRKWLDNLYIEGNTRYGVYDQIYLQGLENETEPPIGILNQRKQTWYYAGVSVKLPLSTIINRKKHLLQTEKAIEVIRQEKEMMADDLTKTIIEGYYDVLFKYESMHTFYAIYQDLRIAYLDAVNRLQEQKVNFHDYAILSSTYGKAKNDYDLAKSDFLKSINMLRFIAGWDF